MDDASRYAQDPVFRDGQPPALASPGNYITLTNLTDREAQHRIGLRISPINVSVTRTLSSTLHHAGQQKRPALPGLYHRRSARARSVMNDQIVGLLWLFSQDQLRRTLQDLTGDAVFNLLYSWCRWASPNTPVRASSARWTRPHAEIIDIADEYGRRIWAFSTGVLLRRQAVPAGTAVLPAWPQRHAISGCPVRLSSAKA